MDASFDKLTGQACLGVIGRNHEGTIVIDLTMRTVAISPLAAEAHALREAASLAVNLGLSRVLLESDCLELIQSCRGEAEKGKISLIVQDIKRLKEHFEVCGFT